jgi:DNA-directed RNA polymerase subunit RPC12/RpoP
MERYKKIFKEEITPLPGENLFYCQTCTKLFSDESKSTLDLNCPHCGSKKVELYKI